MLQHCKTSPYLCYSLSAGTVTRRAWSGLGPCVTPNVNINYLFTKLWKGLSLEIMAKCMLSKCLQGGHPLLLKISVCIPRKGKQKKHCFSFTPCCHKSSLHVNYRETVYSYWAASLTHWAADGLCLCMLWQTDLSLIWILYRIWEKQQLGVGFLVLFGVFSNVPCWPAFIALQLFLEVNCCILHLHFCCTVYFSKSGWPNRNTGQAQ